MPAVKGPPPFAPSFDSELSEHRLWYSWSGITDDDSTSQSPYWQYDSWGNSCGTAMNGQLQ